MDCPTGAPPGPANRSDWLDANVYLRNHLPAAAIRNAWRPGSGAVSNRCLYTWQRGIVLDPADRAYRQFLLDQLQRHFDYLPHFQGIVIDRSDWNNFYDLDRDDGMSWVDGRPAYSLKRAYMNVTNALQAQMQAQGRDTGMLINTYGYACLSLMAPYDGSFSEGHAISAVGLLGIVSPAIMWTYDTRECCSSRAAFDPYMQWRMLLAVFPMAPFPGNDHSIDPNATAQAWYADYGHMFAALQGVDWSLTAHAVQVNDTDAKANAFVRGTLHLYPVILGTPAPPAPNRTILLTVRDVPAGVAFAATYPGDPAWHPLASSGDGGVAVTVPLRSGCALVRAM